MLYELFNPDITIYREKCFHLSSIQIVLTQNIAGGKTLSSQNFTRFVSKYWGMSCKNITSWYVLSFFLYIIKVIIKYINLNRYLKIISPLGQQRNNVWNTVCSASHPGQRKLNCNYSRRGESIGKVMWKGIFFSNEKLKRLTCLSSKIMTASIYFLEYVEQCGKRDIFLKGQCCYEDGSAMN